MAISGTHKIDDIRVNYDDGLSGKGIFDKNEKKFIGYINIHNTNNYELNRIGINKTKGTISKYRDNNKELFSKVDFVANEYFYPIENIQIDNKNDLYYLDKISARAKLFDKIDPSDIDEITIRYGYDGDRSITLTKNNKNEFVGETYIKDQFKKFHSIRIKRNNGNYINYDREKIDNADNLDINPKLPIDSINIDNQQDNYYIGEEISLTASNVRENINYIEIIYENDHSVNLYKDDDFKNNMILSKSGDYKIESISLRGEGWLSIHRDEIPKEILDSLEFKATSYNMPISSIDIEKKEDVALFDKIKINAIVDDEDITKIKISTERNQEIILDKSSDNIFSGDMKVKYKDDEISKLTIFKNNKEISFTDSDIEDLKDSISISNIKMPFALSLIHS